MKEQSFRVTIRVSGRLGSKGKSYLTEARVKRQIEKFLRGRSITEGLPCHGKNPIVVTDVLEDNPRS